MNRPNKKDYMNIIVNPFVLGLDETAYRKDLEKYCDELEREKDFVNKVVIPDYHLVLERLAKTKKALDKACEKLSWYSWYVTNREDEAKSKKEWEEWSMRDE